MESWIWGLSLIALTMAVHGTGLVLVALVLDRLRDQLTSHNVLTPMLILVTTVGVFLATLHLLEAGLWAAAYWWVGAIGTPSDAILYSVDCISTRGASRLLLEPRWQMMGALEAVDGMLLFGISTAFIFAVIQTYWSLLHSQRAR